MFTEDKLFLCRCHIYNSNHRPTPGFRAYVQRTIGDTICTIALTIRVHVLYLLPQGFTERPADTGILLTMKR
jgi:hypothetical protein